MKPFVKEDAHRMIDQLPPDATWEDLIYQVYVLEAIKNGLAASAANQVHTSDEVQTRLQLSVG